MLIFMMLTQAYTNLNVFKRIEVWILLVLTVAGLVFVLLNREPTTEDSGFANSSKPGRVSPGIAATPDANASSAPSNDTLLEIKNVSLRREGEHFLAEVKFVFNNQTAQPVRTIEDAKLITGGGESIPVFFLAFTGAPPEIPATKKSQASLHFSLRGETIVGALALDIGGHRAPIKSSRSFDPESIADNQSKTFNQLDW
jgi:hypothetical protein